MSRKYDADETVMVELTVAGLAALRELATRSLHTLQMHLQLAREEEGGLSLGHKREDENRIARSLGFQREVWDYDDAVAELVSALACIAHGDDCVPCQKAWECGDPEVDPEADAQHASEAHCERNGAIVKLHVVCDEEVEYDA